MSELITTDSPRERANQLRNELREAQQALRGAEAELAAEQAAVNAFRMHCRLLLDDLVDAIQALLADKQAALTRLALLRQKEELDAEESNPLGPDAGSPSEPEPDPVEELLPTDTPHDKAAEKRLYRELARRFHPDKASSSMELAYRTSMMAAVNDAYAVGNTRALYDLAGELEPDELAELSLIDSLEVRRLSEQLLRCRRRQRKVSRQLAAAREESTARLWRKAQELEEGGDNWWALVRRDLEAARVRLEGEVAALDEQIVALDMEPLETTGDAGNPR